VPGAETRIKETIVKKFLVAVLLSLSFVSVAFADRADGLYLELGAGYDRHIYTGKNPQSVIRLRYEWESPAWWTPDVFEIDHHSSFQDGVPFNHNAEDTIGQASFIWRFKIK
jgi:hypothetical protein